MKDRFNYSNHTNNISILAANLFSGFINGSKIIVNLSLDNDINFNGTQ